MTGEPIYDPTNGELLGFAEVAPDGAIVMLDPSETAVVAAVTQAGEVLDHENYEVDGESDYVTRDDLAAFAAEQDQLAAESQARQQALYDPNPGPSEQDVEAMLDENLRRLESSFGRPLTSGETDRVYAAVNSQMAAGESPDWTTAGYEAGLQHVDGMDHEARSAYMSERLRDQEEPRQARAEYDLDDRESRQQFIQDRMDGLIDSATAE